MKRLARAVLTVCMAVSIALSALAAYRIATSDALAPLRERTAQEIVAATDSMMVRDATPERLSSLIASRLGEEPRNWVALTALHDLAVERRIALPADLSAAYDRAWAEDGSLVHQAADCASCAWDISTCNLSNVMICKLPLLLTPVEDLRGITKAGWNYLSGVPVDRVDLGLSIVGLGATALVLVSGGTAETLKIGAAGAKMARGMKILSRGIEDMAVTAIRTGVDWKSLARLDEGGADLARAIHPEAFRPLAEVTSDIGRIGLATDASSALHLMRYVKDAPDADRMARAAEALGPRTVARVEVLGPARLMRATLRWSETAWELISGFLGLVGSIAAFLIGLVKGIGWGLLRRLAR